MYQTVAAITTKACNPIANHACFTLNNDGVSPVETQNLASHELKARQRQAYIHLTLSRILACETLEARQRRAFTRLALLRILACDTQDFASLLWIIHIYSALFSCIKRWQL